MSGKKISIHLCDRGGLGERDKNRLTDTSDSILLIRIKTTLNIDDRLLAQASRLTGIDEITALVRLGLEALVERHSARRLAALGGSESGARRVPRRRTT